MLEIENLKVGYGKKPVLKDVSLSIAAGEVVALVGPNAAGKSTTLRTLAGLKRPDGGSIRLMGQNIEAASTVDRVRRGLVLVPEGRQIFPRMTVMQNLQMGAYHRPDRNRVDGELERIFAMFPRLGERRDQLAGSMSGGEQQMLAIGRGLLAKPKLMLLDEPTLGLAPIVIEELGRIVRMLAAEGLTILLAEQNAAMALGCCDRAYLIDSGTMVMAGSAAELGEADQIKDMYLAH